MMHKARSAKIDSLSTAEWQRFHRLLSSRELMTQFADEIMRFSRTPLKPDEVLRRFSLNGDGQLDLREFQLAAKRLELDGANAPPALVEARARALYLAFCPTPSRKLDIDIFCRIMTEWSLQLMRDMFEQQSMQQQRQPQRSVRAAPNAIATPYATEPQLQPATPSACRTADGSASRPNNSDSSSCTNSNSTSGNSSSDRVHLNEAEAIWRRISVPVAQHSDKLRQLFLRLDVSCSGCVSQEEFEIALRHIGVFLTPREFDRLYESLDDQLKIVSSSGGGNSTFTIKYTELLTAIQGLSQPTARGLPSTSKQTSPPVVTVASARLWDMLVAALDKLRSLFQQYQRIQQHSLAPETFRDCLRQCGIVLSNADFAALRVRLLPHTDSTTGAIDLTSLADALKMADHTNSQSRAASTPPYLASNKQYTNRSSAMSPAAAALGVSPIRTGRKTNFSPSSAGITTVPHPAGKSNEQRNAEAERTMVRIRDESRWHSDLNFPVSTSPTASTTSAEVESEQQRREQFQHHKQHQQDPFFAAGGKPPPALEARVLAKLQQVRELGQLGGACSPQTIFPGDRFGRITRGQFRQGLVHLGVLARYAEVEALFWTLDPAGRGYIVTRDLYDHLTAFAASRASNSSVGNGGNAWKHLRPSITTDDATKSSPVSGHRLARSVQKVLERMLLDFPQLYAVCERGDINKTGTVSPPELLSAIQELGILASVADTQMAIAALCPPINPASRSSSVASEIAIPYRTLDARLAQLCSDLLSPKKRKKMHLSTASVLLAPHEQLYSERLSSSKSGEFDMNTVSETDALWNCPRRRMNQEHRANKTSIRIGDAVQPDPSGLDNNSMRHDDANDTLDRRERRRLLAVVAIIHDLLERRSDLKTVMDLHRSADAHGQVTKRDLVDILMTSRLSLDFTRGVSAAAFVDALYPSPSPSSPLSHDANTHVSVGYLDLLHRCSDLLAESTRVLQTSRLPAATPSKKQQQRQTARRLDSTVAFGSSGTSIDTTGSDAMLPAMYSTSLLQPQHQRDRMGTSGTTTTYGTGSLEGDIDPMVSVRRKLLSESRLRDLLWSDEGRQSAAVLVRHAFKGLAPREMVVPVENGEFEAMCRASDLKHACYRLGLDLDTREQKFMACVIDTSGSGFVSSPQVLGFFVHLARTAEGSPSTTDEKTGGAATRVHWGDGDNNSVNADEMRSVATTSRDDPSRYEATKRPDLDRGYAGYPSRPYG